MGDVQERVMRDEAKWFLPKEAVTGLVDENGQGFTVRRRVPLDEPCIWAGSRSIWLCDAFSVKEHVHTLDPAGVRKMRELGFNLTLVELLGPDNKRISAMQALGVTEIDRFPRENAGALPLLIIKDGLAAQMFSDGGPEPYGVLVAPLRDAPAPPLTAQRVRLAVGGSIGKVQCADATDASFRYLDVKEGPSGFLLCGLLVGSPPLDPSGPPPPDYYEARSKNLEIPWSPSDGDPHEHLIATIARTTLAEGDFYAY